MLLDEELPAKLMRTLHVFFSIFNDIGLRGSDIRAGGSALCSLSFKPASPSI